MISCRIYGTKIVSFRTTLLSRRLTSIKEVHQFSFLPTMYTPKCVVIRLCRLCAPLLKWHLMCNRIWVDVHTGCYFQKKMPITYPWAGNNAISVHMGRKNLNWCTPFVDVSLSFVHISGRQDGVLDILSSGEWTFPGRCQNGRCCKYWWKIWHQGIYRLRNGGSFSCGLGEKVRVISILYSLEYKLIPNNRCPSKIGAYGACLLFGIGK